MKRLVPIILLAGAVAVSGTELKPVELPEPSKSGGMPLMEALANRRTGRNFDPEKMLSERQLSDLLWAAAGINRPDGKRTAPTACNWQEIDVYVALKEGVFLYNPQEHRLDPVLAEDVRSSVGIQGFTKNAPVGLIYVADYSRMKLGKEFYSATDTGFISQNVYLYCASENLSTVVLGLVNKPGLEKKLGLGKKQHVVLTQCVGFPVVQ